MPRPRHASAASLVEAAPVFAALGDATRLGLVARLCTHGPQSIVRLSQGATISRQAVTKHLHALAGAGLVRSQPIGRERVWELEPKRLEEVRRQLDRISADWDAAIDRLRALVEPNEG
jgi:DNA-binding transcriptional ArsR family regulator